MIWLQHFYAQPNFANVAASIGAYIVMAWACAYLLIVTGLWDKFSDQSCFNDYPPPQLASAAWPIAFVVLFAYLAFAAFYRICCVVTSPAFAVRGSMVKYKCAGCDSRVPWASTYCPKCGFKRTKEIQ